MQFKMFSASGPEEIVKAVNDWLADKTGVSIRHTETKFEVLEGAKSLLLFSVWYDE